MARDDVFGGWARAYSIIQGPDGQNMGREADEDYYSRAAADVSGKILEIGCGTGRISLRLLQEGHDVYGIDSSEDQLAFLRSEAEARGLDPDVRRADMRDFDIEGEFELILVPFNTFRHNLTIDDQLRTLRNVRAHLSETGRAIVDFSLPTREWYLDERVLTTEFTRDGSEYFLVESYQLVDEMEQILGISRKLYEDGRLVGEVEYEYARIYRREFVHLLHRAGIEEWDAYAGFDHEPLEDAGPALTAVWELYK